MDNKNHIKVLAPSLKMPRNSNSNHLNIIPAYGFNFNFPYILTSHIKFSMNQSRRRMGRKLNIQDIWDNDPDLSDSKDFTPFTALSWRELFN